MLKKLESELIKKTNPEKAKILQRFFKTGNGQYGEGDIFLGIIVPEQRKIAKQFNNLSIKEIQELLSSNIHEKRLIALLILIDKYKKADEKQKQDIFDFYLNNAKNINNWDLVDLSAPNIIGDFLLEKEKQLLYNLSKSENLWEKRIAIVSTYKFIKQDKFEDTLKISEILLNDKHDLIHKAVGWMLREVGKRNQDVLENFLKKYCRKSKGFSASSNIKNKSNIRRYKNMPRTMLRYAIEKFEEEKRKRYLNGKI